MELNKMEKYRSSKYPPKLSVLRSITKIDIFVFNFDGNCVDFCKSPLSIFQLYRDLHLFSLSLHNNLKTTAPSPIAGHSPLPGHFTMHRGWNFLHRSSEKLVPLGIMGTQSRTPPMVLCWRDVRRVLGGLWLGDHDVGRNTSDHRCITQYASFVGACNIETRPV